jgi:hypothetical protein
MAQRINDQAVESDQRHPRTAGRLASSNKCPWGRRGFQSVGQPPIIFLHIDHCGDAKVLAGHTSRIEAGRWRAARFTLPRVGGRRC